MRRRLEAPSAVAGAPLIELSVRLTDGSFDTSVTLPTDASDDDRNAVVDAWFALIRQAVTLAARPKKPSQEA